jgi:hypothetical protein
MSEKLRIISAVFDSIGEHKMDAAAAQADLVETDIMRIARERIFLQNNVNIIIRIAQYF